MVEGWRRATGEGGGQKDRKMETEGEEGWHVENTALSMVGGGRVVVRP